MISTSFVGKVKFFLLIIGAFFVFWQVQKMVLAHFIAETYCSTIGNITMNRDMNPPEEKIKKAIEADPLNPWYYFKLVNYYEKLRRMDKARRKEILYNLSQFIERNPLRGWIWYRYGNYLSRSIQWDETAGEDSLSSVEQTMDLALSMRPNDERLAKKIELFRKLNKKKWDLFKNRAK